MRTPYVCNRLAVVHAHFPVRVCGYPVRTAVKLVLPFNFYVYFPLGLIGIGTVGVFSDIRQPVITRDRAGQIKLMVNIVTFLVIEEICGRIIGNLPHGKIP